MTKVHYKFCPSNKEQEYLEAAWGASIRRWRFQNSYRQTRKIPEGLSQ